MNARLLGVVALSLGACSGAGVSSQTDHLIASADAQHLGVFSYTVAGDSATMFDKDGIEFGQLDIAAPSADRRLIRFQLATGATDEVEAYRPMADGSFFVPISPVTATTAAVADPALAPLFRAHQMIFNVTRPLAPIAPETVATTSACTGGGTPGSPWTYTTPAGCVRSANTSVSCTNPSQLPATIADDLTGALWSFAQYSTRAPCVANQVTDCVAAYGGTASAWSGKTSCTFQPDLGVYYTMCNTRWTIGQWIASCPRQTCGTSGDYDAVPRQDQCYEPGSCGFQQGTVTCTPYH